MYRETWVDQIVNAKEVFGDSISEIFFSWLNRVENALETNPMRISHFVANKLYWNINSNIINREKTSKVQKF